jgi:hypothetical protein
MTVIHPIVTTKPFEDQILQFSSLLCETGKQMIPNIDFFTAIENPPNFPFDFINLRECEDVAEIPDVCSYRFFVDLCFRQWLKS